MRPHNCITRQPYNFITVSRKTKYKVQINRTIGRVKLKVQDVKSIQLAGKSSRLKVQSMKYRDQSLLNRIQKLETKIGFRKFG